MKVRLQVSCNVSFVVAGSKALQFKFQINNVQSKAMEFSVSLRSLDYKRKIKMHASAFTLLLSICCQTIKVKPLIDMFLSVRYKYSTQFNTPLDSTYGFFL
jgi:hypothetical protein